MSETKIDTYFHNPFEKTTCKKCGHRFDSLKPTCPKCKEESDHPRANPLNDVTFAHPIIELLLSMWAVYSIVRGIISYLTPTNPNVEPATPEQLMFSNYLIYGILFIVLVAIASLSLPKLLKSFTKTDCLWGILVCFAIFAFDIVWGNISSALGATTNENQGSVNKIVEVNLPLAILFLSIIGPMCEELTYRVGVFNFTRRVNRIFGYVVSVFIFGFIHMHDYGNPNEWLSFPSYAFAGLAFAYAYEKWGLGASFIAHFLVNFLAVLSSYYL